MFYRRDLQVVVLRIQHEERQDWEVLDPYGADAPKTLTQRKILQCMGPQTALIVLPDTKKK